LLNELEDFFIYASQKHLDFDKYDFENSKVQNTNLIDIVDFQPHNFMVKVKDNKAIDWKVIDFEYYSENNCERNKVNLGNIRILLSSMV
jgi:hypothetical protein